MNEQLKIIEFDIASLKSNRYPNGAIFVIRVGDSELSIKAEPGQERLSLGYFNHDKKNFQESENLSLTIGEIASKLGFVKKEKEKIPAPRPKK